MKKWHFSWAATFDPARTKKVRDCLGLGTYEQKGCREKKCIQNSEKEISWKKLPFEKHKNTRDNIKLDIREIGGDSAIRKSMSNDGFTISGVYP